MLIYPAIDLIGGEVVRLYQGDFGQKTTFTRSPMEQAELFKQAGAEWLHVVDLDAARTGALTQREVIAQLASHSGLKLQVGGGVRSLEIAKDLLAIGVERVVAGSALVSDPLFRSAFFQELGGRAVAGIDMRDGIIQANGWLEASGIDGLAFARELQQLGCQTWVITDIVTDGTLAGPNVPLLEAWRKEVSGHLIASGGVGTLADIQNVAATGCDGVIVGRALLEGQFSLQEAMVAF